MCFLSKGQETTSPTKWIWCKVQKSGLEFSLFGPLNLLCWHHFSNLNWLIFDTGSPNSKCIFSFWYFRYLYHSYNGFWYLKFFQTCGHLIFCIVLFIMHIHRTRTTGFLSLYIKWLSFSVIWQFQHIFPKFVAGLCSNFQILAQNLFLNKKFHKVSNFEVRRTTSQNERIWKNSHISYSCCLFGEWLDFYLPNNQMSTCLEKFEVSRSIVVMI